MNIHHYRRMLTDGARLRAFRRAIHAGVRPGDVVVEIGAGLGTYSFFAAQAGARRVYAIEADPEVCRLAEAVAEDNGLADRVRFFRGYSTDVELPERADVAIFEDYTSFFFSSRIPGLLRDIWRRFLKRGGRLLPRGIDLYLAGLGDGRLYREVDLLQARRDRLLGLDFGETRRVAMNLPSGAKANRQDLVTRPVRCARINLQQDTELGFAFADEVPALRGGLLHGLLGWMELDLGAGCRLSCSPLRPPTIWGQNFYPFAAPLRVRKGKALKVGMELIFPQGISRYLQRWTVATGTDYREGNTFAGTPLSHNTFAAESVRARGRLGPRSRVLLTALSELSERKTFGHVAATLLKKHPDLFESHDDALASLLRLAPALSTAAGSL